MSSWAEHEDYPASALREPEDSMLARLQIFVEHGRGIGVIVAFPGGVLHGELVSRARWYADWFAGIERAGEAGKEMVSLMRAALSSAGLMGADGAVVDHIGDFLHIKDGRLLNGGQLMEPMPWRVRRSSVTAWSLGALPPEPGS